jgi:hypothetical protein
VWLVVELTPSDGMENGGKLDVQPHSLEQVHIVYTSVNKLSNMEGLQHLPPLSVLDGDVVVIFHGHLCLCRVVA